MLGSSRSASGHTAILGGSPYRSSAWRRGRLAACALLVSAIGFGALLGVLSLRPGGETLRTPPRAHSETSPAGLIGLPSAARGPVSSALGASSSSYWISAGASGMHASNPAQRLDERFGQGGVMISSAGLRMYLQLRGFGYGGAERAVGAVAPRARANRVTYAHAGISEWYANGPLGLEQGFDVSSAPTAAGSGPLTLSIALWGNARAALGPDGRSVTLTEAGEPPLRYSGLLATDARGRTLPSWLELRGRLLLLRVDTSRARFPVRIDPFVQQGEKLTGSGESGAGESGYSVAISGTKAVIGAPADDGEVGAAWIFAHRDGAWMQEGEKLTAKGGEETGAGRFGQSVSLSGKIALIGAPADDGSAGAVWVFVRPKSGGTWTQQGPKLTPAAKEESGSGDFGASVALSGTSAIVGAPADSSGRGAAWVFTQEENKKTKTFAWSQQAGKLDAKSGEEVGSGHFGASVALAGTTSLIGAPDDNGETGAAWVFASSGPTWTQQGAKLTGEGTLGTARFGTSVALSSEANTALIGGPGDDGEAGGAWVFIDSGTWTQQGEKLVPALGEEAGPARFGEAVALSGSGDTALIGADRDNSGTGAAWEFARSGSVWSQQGEKLTGSGESGTGAFGHSIALSSTGDQALVGGPGDDARAGAAWQFAVPLGPVPVEVTPPTISADEQEGDTVLLTHGSWENSPREYSDQWLRCNSAGGACEAIEGEDGQSYVLSSADVGHTVRVQEIASNAAGESEPAESAASSIVVASPLAAVPGESVHACAGQEADFDGSASTPAAEISSYNWEFGDSTNAEGAIVKHVYSSPGSYTATLTVHRGAEQESARVAVQVSSCSGPGPGKATVHVQGTESQPISGAEVLYVAPGGARTEAVAEASGEAVLPDLPEGSDAVYAYATGYRPRVGHIAVNGGGEGTTTITLEKGEIAAVGIKSHEMSLAEIEAAGIDPNDPANQQVFEFVVELAFPFPGGGNEGGGGGEGRAKLECYVNSAEQLVGSCRGGGGKRKTGKEGKWSCTSTGCETIGPEGSGFFEEEETGGGSEGGGGGLITIHPVPPPPGAPPGAPPAIQWLILRGRASMLKQFLEVSMGIVNLGTEEPFELVDNKATLNLPEGLSLAPTPTPQSPTQSLPDIAPESSASANWIVRGDKPGEYLLSADYHGTLEPFEAPISAQAALATPFHVWGANALKLKVRADEGKYLALTPYHVTLGVEDVANIPLYNVALSVDEEPHEHYIFQPRQQFAQTLGELKPKETAYVKRPYVLLTCETSEGVFDPALSNATFVGEETHPGEGIEQVKPLPLYEISAPTDNASYVHLRWKKRAGVEGYGAAEGYEVFAVHSCAEPFGSLPLSVRATPTSSPVEELPASAEEAYVAAKPGETLLYAVSTVQEGKSVKLEMPLVEGAVQAPPEFGRCAKVQAGRKGRYSSSKCSAPGGKEGYEWASEAVKTGVTLSGSAATLETTAKTKIACESLGGSGHHAGGERLEGLALTLKGCELEGKACSSSGAGAGEVRSSTLTGALVWESKASGKVALDLYRTPAGALLNFECSGRKVEVRGSVLTAVKTGKMAASESLKYKAKKGVQSLVEYETAQGEKVAGALEASVAGGAFTPTGLSTKLTLTGEEPLEINPVV